MLLMKLWRWGAPVVAILAFFGGLRAMSALQVVNGAYVGLSAPVCKQLVAIVDETNKDAGYCGVRGSISTNIDGSKVLAPDSAPNIRILLPENVSYAYDGGDHAVQFPGGRVGMATAFALTFIVVAGILFSPEVIKHQMRKRGLST